jgi:hypothetical protein
LVIFFGIDTKIRKEGRRDRKRRRERKKKYLN